MAPTKYIVAVFLYSAFSSILPNIYFIPINIIVITDIIIPATLTTPNITPAVYSSFSRESGEVREYAFGLTVGSSDSYPDPPFIVESISISSFVIA